MTATVPRRPAASCNHWSSGPWHGVTLPSWQPSGAGRTGWRARAPVDRQAASGITLARRAITRDRCAVADDRGRGARERHASLARGSCPRSVSDGRRARRGREPARGCLRGGGARCEAPAARRCECEESGDHAASCAGRTSRGGTDALHGPGGRCAAASALVPLAWAGSFCARPLTPAGAAVAFGADSERRASDRR